MWSLQMGRQVQRTAVHQNSMEVPGRRRVRENPPGNGELGSQCIALGGPRALSCLAQDRITLSVSVLWAPVHQACT